MVLSPALPSDFAIRFAYGLCTTDVLDTSNGSFVRDMGLREPTVSIGLVFPRESLRAIYDELVAARFFEYPTTFHVSGSTAFVSPAMHYRLEVRSGGATHTVTWIDGNRPSNPEADRLRDLFTRLITLVEEHPSVKGLPRARVGCM